MTREAKAREDRERAKAHSFLGQIGDTLRLLTDHLGGYADVLRSMKRDERTRAM